MKIYALVIGKGSDYEIIEAFSGKAKADDAKNKFTDVTEYRGRCRVEELELDELVEPGCCYRFYTNAVLPWLWGSPCNTSHFVLWT